MTFDSDFQEAVSAEMKSVADRCGLRPDRSLRAHHREFRKVVEASDVVLEVLDARDPLGCRCLQVEEAVLTSGANKKLILVLNKIGEESLSPPSLPLFLPLSLSFSLSPLSLSLSLS